MVRNFTFHACDETICQLFLAKLGWRNKTIVTLPWLETEQKNMAPVQQSGSLPEINEVIPPISRVRTPVTHDFRSVLRRVFTLFISSFPGPRKKLRLSYSSDLIYIYLEPVCPLFWWLNPSKQGLFQSKQGSFGFQVYIYMFSYGGGSQGSRAVRSFPPLFFSFLPTWIHKSSRSRFFEQATLRV